MRMAANNHTEKKNSAEHHHHPSASGNSNNRNGLRHQSDPTHGSTEAGIAAAVAEHGHHHIEPDLFSILSSMHLNNQLNSNGSLGVGGPQVINMPHPVIVTSRKRKILDGGHGSGINGNGAGKMNGMRPPAHRRTSDDDDEAPLQTPQCSQSGMYLNILCIEN